MAVSSFCTNFFSPDVHKKYTQYISFASCTLRRKHGEKVIAAWNRNIRGNGSLGRKLFILGGCTFHCLCKQCRHKQCSVLLSSMKFVTRYNMGVCNHLFLPQIEKRAVSYFLSREGCGI